MDKFGPFVSIVGIALALVAVFSTLLVRMLGRLTQWTWLTTGSPSFMVTAGARMVAVVLMAITYATIDRSNIQWFEVAAVIVAGFGFWSVLQFDRLRKLHVIQVPLIGKNGQPLLDKGRKPRSENVVIGLESQLRPEAKAALDKARKHRGGISLPQFMAGYGSSKLNDPEALWARDLLIDISNRMTLILMLIVLSAVMTVYLAAFVVEVSGRGA